MATLADLDTSVVTIDLDIVEANIARLQTYLDGHGIKNRPHIKTHKIPTIAQKQVAAGAVGIACQKIGSARRLKASGWWRHVVRCGSVATREFPAWRSAPRGGPGGIARGTLKGSTKILTRRYPGRRQPCRSHQA
jgi:hypothetical protein